MKRLNSLAVAASLVMLAGCGGSQAVAPRAASSAAPGSTTSSVKATATLKITIPARTASTSTSKRRAQYVSPATQSIAVAFTPTPSGTTQTFNQNLTTASNPSCTASLISPEVCTVTLTLAPGAYTATFATYDGLLDGSNNPTGNILSQNQSIPVTVVAGQANSINVTLQGVPASVALIPGAGAAFTGSQSAGYGLSKCFASQSVSVIGLDADGNYILGPGAPTPSITSSDTTQLIIAGPTTSAPNTFTVTRPGIPTANRAITLTPTVTPGSGGSAASANVALTFDATICGTITEYALPTSNSLPYGIASGPDGALWFTESDLGKIGRISTSGSITEFATPSFSAQFGITAGPDGAIWFTEYGVNNIGRITTSGSITEFAIPTSSAGSFLITPGPDGALWFAEANGFKIGRITTGGAFTEYATPTSFSTPVALALGADGALWFTEEQGNKIGRITTSGSITEFALPTSNSAPFGIALGSDGALWFTEAGGGGNKIGRISSSGSITEFAIPTPTSGAEVIVPGPDGALWFVEDIGNKIGRISSNGSITEFVIPTSGSFPFGITTGPDGALWFVETTGNKIGRLQ